MTVATCRLVKGTKWPEMVTAGLNSLPAVNGRPGVLHRLLDEALGGTSGIMVLFGEPGVGKTALPAYPSRPVAGANAANPADDKTPLHNYCSLKQVML